MRQFVANLNDDSEISIKKLKYGFAASGGGNAECSRRKFCCRNAVVLAKCEIDCGVPLPELGIATQDGISLIIRVAKLFMQELSKSALSPRPNKEGIEPKECSKRSV